MGRFRTLLGMEPVAEVDMQCVGREVDVVTVFGSRLLRTWRLYGVDSQFSEL
jgi:hypothetical protein